MVYAATTARDFPELIEALSEQRAKLLQDGLTEREIGDSIRHLSGSFIMSLDDVESRMKRIARQYLFSGYALDPEETLGMISSVNPSSVARMAERAFAYDDVLAYGKIGGRERNRLAARNPLWK
jgi:predicted Zn-dependent peptidase